MLPLSVFLTPLLEKHLLSLLDTSNFDKEDLLNYFFNEKEHWCQLRFLKIL